MLAFEVHARRLAALKALTSASTSSSEMMENLSEIVFGILEKVGHSCQLWVVQLHWSLNFYLPKLLFSFPGMWLWKVVFFR